MCEKVCEKCGGEPVVLSHSTVSVLDTQHSLFTYISPDSRTCQDDDAGLPLRSIEVEQVQLTGALVMVSWMGCVMSAT